MTVIFFDIYMIRIGNNHQINAKLIYLNIILMKNVIVIFGNDDIIIFTHIGEADFLF